MIPFLPSPEFAKFYGNMTPFLPQINGKKKKRKKKPLKFKRDFYQMQCINLWILIRINKLYMRYFGNNKGLSNIDKLLDDNK